MESLRIERSGGVVTVALSRPERKNAIDVPLWHALADAFLEIERSGEDRVMVLTGDGGDFCSGSDLAGMKGDDKLLFMAYVSEAARALHVMSIPTIAKVDGVAVGAGWNLALGCDLVVASDRARFSEIFVRRALSLDAGGSWLLPKFVGLQKAKEIAFFGDMYSASQVADMGMATRVVPSEELDVVVAEMAARLATGPARALTLTKRLLDQAAEGTSLEQALRNESSAQVNNVGGPEADEAKAAFLEKRPPDFARARSAAATGR